VTVIEFIGGNIKPRRFVLLRACPAARGAALRAANAPEPQSAGGERKHTLAPFACAGSAPPLRCRCANGSAHTRTCVCGLTVACASPCVAHSVATELVATVAAVAAVAEALKFAPSLGVPPPKPPTANTDAATVAAAEFAIAFSTFTGARATGAPAGQPCTRTRTRTRSPAP
jgi:hypothetical protein